MAQKDRLFFRVQAADPLIAQSAPTRHPNLIILTSHAKSFVQGMKHEKKDFDFVSKVLQSCA